jgi:transcriptional regulator with XRE-family HTH domain
MARTEDIQVGKSIRALRERQGLSLRTLAERSGLSLNAISLIERGENSPTVSSLQMLASALEVPITDFFSAEQNQAVVFVKPPARLRSQVDGISMESLGTGLRNQQLDPFLLKVDPGKGNVDRPVGHSGEEFVYCLEGAIDYYVGEQVYHLEPGYSLLFAATIPHTFYNRKEKPALLMIIFHAGAGSLLGRHQHLASSSEEDSDENLGQFNSR